MSKDIMIKTVYLAYNILNCIYYSYFVSTIFSKCNLLVKYMEYSDKLTTVDCQFHI